MATPALEYLETFARGFGAPSPAGWFVVVDRTGELLALRPEMTVPVARFIATRWSERVARLYYAGSVFRGEPHRGTGREFLQAGVELVGQAGTDADAELVALAVEALQACGVAHVKIGLGHAAFLRAVLEGADFEEEDRRAAQVALYRRDFVTLASLVQSGRSPARKALRDLPSLRGPDALQRARALGVGTAAVEELAQVLAALGPYDVIDQVEVDLGIIRDFDYYTGLVLEAYAPGSGAPLLGGGRYDQLLERFGASRPAVGFALHLERVLSACETVPSSPPVLEVAYEPAVREQALRWVRSARAAGLRVAASPGSVNSLRRGVNFRRDGVWWVEDGLEQPLGPDALDQLLGRQKT